MKEKERKIPDSVLYFIELQVTGKSTWRSLWHWLLKEKKDESDTNPTRGKLVPWGNKKAKLI